MLREGCAAYVIFINTLNDPEIIIKERFRGTVANVRQPRPFLSRLNARAPV